ncbi:MAG: UDP-N-acetylmuramate--L-alanine ligase, partial [Gaiellaceae bacterium]
EEVGAALSQADAVCLTEIYAAREEPAPGVTGKLVVEALARRRPGMWIGWAPELEHAGPMVARLAREGDVAVTMGAGNVDDAASVILDELGG